MYQQGNSNGLTAFFDAFDHRHTIFTSILYKHQPVVFMQYLIDFIIRQNNTTIASQYKYTTVLQK